MISSNQAPDAKQLKCDHLLNVKESDYFPRHHTGFSTKAIHVGSEVKI